MSKHTPGPPMSETANDALLLQASDVPESPAVLLVDLSSIAHPIYHMSQQEPDPDHTSQRTAAVVRSLAADHPHTAICCDSRSNFRKELDSTYKANRPEGEAPLHHQMDLACDALDVDGFPVWCVDGFEADDLIATATRLLTATGERAVLIASADKDLLALVSDRVEVHSTRTGSRLGPDDVRAKLGVGPGLVVDYLTLVGDASDNIRGAKGIGPKTAAEILGFFGSLDAVYLAIDTGSASSLKPAQLASLEELSPRLEAVRSLVRMRTDVPLDIDAVFKPRVPRATEEFMEGDEMEPEVEVLLPEPQPEPVKPAAPSVASAITGVAVATAPVAVVAQPAPAEWERVLEPRSLDDACKLAKRLFDTKLFSDYGTPQAVLSTVMLGRELGLPTMSALRSIHMVKGKHTLSAELMVALVLRSGKAEYFTLIETTDKICTYETKRKGTAKPQRLSYTIEQATKAGLTAPPRPGKEPGPWHKLPTQMLRARAKSELARLEYPDLLAGLYTPEELKDAN